MSIINCPKCNIEFDNFSKYGAKKFCSRKCANSRIFTKETRQKQSESFRRFFSNLSEHERLLHSQKTHPYFKPKIIEQKLKLPIPEIVGDYSKIYLCKCKYSNAQFYSPTIKQIHPELSRTKKEYSYSCRFKFAISSYPKWFDNASSLISEFGWYSTPGSRRGKTNLNGISRDHLYSITDGWINKVPPNIIRHPANCALIPHKQNQSKYRKSVISLEELHLRINEFEKLYGCPPR